MRMEKERKALMQPDLNWLVNPEVFAVGRLPAHSDHRWYQNEAELAQKTMALRQSLNGEWQFAYSPNPAARPADFWKEEADRSAFGRIQVPGHVELQGYGQIQYINTMYPWDGRSDLRPPQIDWNDAPVSSYVRRFDLDPALAGKPVCICLEGVEQAFYLWLNGQFIGYSEDSFTPAHFDLTNAIRPKDNLLCVEVHKRSSAGWLEDQDFFRFSGIFRPVYLYAKPQVHIEDLWLRAGLAGDNTTGTLAPRLRLSGETEGAAVECRVSDPAGRVLFEGPVNPDGSTVIRLPDVRAWDHDHPVLYSVLFTVKNAAGQVVELVPYSTGFRRFELKNGLLLLNGERVMFNGVNRHEWSAERGRAITDEDMDRAMDTFRRANINAVRTCHYPDQSRWYDLCDENGIYMIDETNLESHGSWQKMGAVEPSWNVPGSLPQWKECVVDRARSMFERDKNHTAILFWSCGNESYAGEDILAMSRFFHENDPSRLVHYEGVFHNREFDRISDVESRMYATPEAIREYLEAKPEKPFLLCEYMHDMGNSLGGMESYIRLGEEFDQYQGGFIWDYMDQALWRTDSLGRRVLGYGGDFGERPTDYNFSANGIVFADGSEKPAMQEVRYWYSTPEQRAAHDANNRRAAQQSARQLAELQKERAGRADTAPDLTVIEGDVNLGVQGAGFEVLFSYVEAGPVSLISQGVQWLYRAPRPALWRAATENDIGNGFAAKSAAWMAADAFARCTGWTVREKGPRKVEIAYEFAFAAVPSAKVEIVYTVDAAGTLRVKAEFAGAPGLPGLPVFGVRLVLPEPASAIGWTGLSGETYPDRKKGGVFGRHTEIPHIPDYLVPQDCGVHMDTHQFTLERRVAGQPDAARLEVFMEGEPFAFSALPYTAQELQNADHREQLPNTGRTVVTVMGAVRGVGGIDSWGADVEPAYRLSAEENHRLEFAIQL